MRARNLQNDFEQNGHDVFATSQANLGVVFTDLENLPDLEQLQQIWARIRVTNA